MNRVVLILTRVRNKAEIKISVMVVKGESPVKAIQDTTKNGDKKVNKTTIYEDVLKVRRDVKQNCREKHAIGNRDVREDGVKCRP